MINGPPDFGMSQVLHIKNPSSCVKDEVLYFCHLILMYCGIWVCDVIERVIEGVHYEFY